MDLQQWVCRYARRSSGRDSLIGCERLRVSCAPGSSVQLRSVAQRIRVDGLQRRRRVVISCAPGSSEQLQQDDAVQFLHGALVALNEGPRCRRVFASGGIVSRAVQQDCCHAVCALLTRARLRQRVCATHCRAAQFDHSVGRGKARQGPFLLVRVWFSSCRASFSWCKFCVSSGNRAGPDSISHSICMRRVSASACGVCTHTDYLGELRALVGEQASVVRACTHARRHRLDQHGETQYANSAWFARWIP